MNGNGMPNMGKINKINIESDLKLESVTSLKPIFQFYDSEYEKLSNEEKRDIFHKLQVFMSEEYEKLKK